MAATYDTRCLDLAELLLGDLPGVTRDDIYGLASDFQDAFEGVAHLVEERFADASTHPSKG